MQLMHALSPQQPVIFSDTGDLLIGNSLSRPHLDALSQIATSNRMLVAAECNSWPVCYRPLYVHDTEHQQCLGKHGACYPNSGVIVASARTLLTFFDAWAHIIVHSGLAMSQSGHAKARARSTTADALQLNSYRFAERWNDQAAIHRLYLNRSTYERDAFTLQVDATNLFSLQLWKCDGPQTSKKRFEYCFERPFEPAKGVRANAEGTAVEYTDERGVRAATFLVHSNGHHAVMRQNETHLQPLLDRFAAWPPPAELLRHPVVLVDTAKHGACNLTTLGWMMNATRWPEGAPNLKF